MTDILLSDNFKLSELVKSDTARKKGILNQPNYKEIENLTRLCKELLQPIRDEYKKPIIVTSGFRNKALNTAVGGSSTSMHMQGLAADIMASDGNNKALWNLIIKLRDAGKISFDQLIDEKKLSWIHIGLHPNKNRNQILYL